MIAMRKITMKILMYFCLPLLVTSCGTAVKKESSKPMTVKVYRAEALTGQGEREFTFLSKPYKSSGLSFRVGGPVVDFDVHSGQFYREGQTIAAIDSRDFRIRKDKAEAVYRQAEAEYRRIAALYEKGNISGSSYEKARADEATAKAAFETTSNELSDAQLKAPFDGYIQSVDIERFQDVKASQTVVTFIDLSRLKIEAYIPENIAIGMGKNKSFADYALRLRFDAVAGKEYTPTEIEISKSTTSNNLSFLLTAIVENPGGELFGGMSGRLSFTLPEAETTETVVVPQTAVCHYPGADPFVWKLDPQTGKVTRASVRIGDLQKNNGIAIMTGLSAGETVVLTGHEFLAENKVVTVQK